MGVDCRITLPAAVKIDDVSIVLAGLCGHQIAVSEFDNHGVQCRAACVAHLDVSAGHSPRVATIAMPDGLSFLYHFEFDDDGRRGLMPRSRPFNAAIGAALVTFFGGEVVYQDYGDDDDERLTITPVFTYREREIDEWQWFQDRLFAVAAITPEDVAAFVGRTAYDDAGNWN